MREALRFAPVAVPSNLSLVSVALEMALLPCVFGRSSRLKRTHSGADICSESSLFCGAARSIVQQFPRRILSVYAHEHDETDHGPNTRSRLKQPNWGAFRGLLGPSVMQRRHL